MIPQWLMPCYDSLLIIYGLIGFPWWACCVMAQNVVLTILVFVLAAKK